MWSTGGKTKAAAPTSMAPPLFSMSKGPATKAAPAPATSTAKEAKAVAPASGGLKSVLGLASSIAPAVLANVLPEIHVNLMCAHEATGSIVVLGAKGRLCYVNVQHAAPILHDLTTTPAMAATLATATGLSFNASGTRVLVEASASNATPGSDLYTFELPFGARNVPSTTTGERVLVKFKDGTSRAVTLSKRQGVDTLQRAMDALTSDERANVKTVCQDVFDIDLQRVTLPPNVRSRHALWHPLSDAHVAILSTIEDLRLVDVHDGSTDQVHALACAPTTSAAVHSTAIAFGPSTGWEVFTVYILRSNGDVYALNPFVPSTKAAVATSLLVFLKQKTEALLSTASSQEATVVLKAQRHWLDELWPTAVSRPAVSKFSAPLHDEEDEPRPAPLVPTTRISTTSGLRPHTWPLQLQGPFQRAGASWTRPSDAAARSLSAVPYPLQDNNIGQHPVLAVAYSSGHVEIVVLAKEARPLWQSSHVSPPPPSPLYVVEVLDLGTDANGGKAVLRAKAHLPYFVYVLHSTSVHVIHAHWMRSPLTGPVTSAVRRVFSVSPNALASSHAIGASILHTVELGHLIVVQLVSGAFEIVNVSAAVVPSVTATKLRSPPTSSSSSLVPLRDLVDATNAKRPSTTTAHVAGATPLSHATMATVQFTLDHVRQLNDEVAYLTELQLLASNRLSLHKEMATKQTSSMAELQKHIAALEASTIALSDRVKHVQATQARLNARAAAALQAIRDNQVVVTKAEIKYKEDLVDMQTQVRRLTPQVVQMNMDAEKLLRTAKPTTPSGRSFSDEKERMVHDVLTAETQLIADAKAILNDLTAKVATLKLSVA
ncbi:hypothetical protein SPRG_03685 [Saprolegnia parasitica CBS 223.65]|uniref:Nucleoporin Nup88 n=1 Tax=Saprolegnia parasitica (strain CBS 223.65) TaxID=695850 RepID=A0A067CRA6_SAPPC|nr:hypothetical protein SPRG_03685 [Saprolegnia parasitica CBS 223.65]KDO31765.1 hypothetical protein SPRG_03685 [Saprolegnia parasitica CBS 223.65]|eukprot:XP_012197645.1 hypothetical protein SPRG_03685 [Saprolegnia parasitica CBS 223.65]